MKRVVDLREDKNCINVFRLVYTQGPIEYEKLFSDGKKLRKNFIRMMSTGLLYI